MTIISYFWRDIFLQYMSVNKEKINKSTFFFYAASSGISKKPLNIIWQPSICRQSPPLHFALTPSPFSRKNFQTPLFPSILDKLSSRPLWKGGGLTMGWVYTMWVCLIVPIFTSPITLSPVLRVSTIQSLKVLCLQVIIFNYNCLCRLM